MRPGGPIKPGELCVIIKSRWGFEKNIGAMIRVTQPTPNKDSWEFAEASRALLLAIEVFRGWSFYGRDSFEVQRRFPGAGPCCISDSHLMPIRDPDQGIDETASHEQDQPVSV